MDVAKILTDSHPSIRKWSLQLNKGPSGCMVRAMKPTPREASMMPRAWARTGSAAEPKARPERWAVGVAASPGHPWGKTGEIVQRWRSESNESMVHTCPHNCGKYMRNDLYFFNALSVNTQNATLRQSNMAREHIHTSIHYKFITPWDRPFWILEKNRMSCRLPAPPTYGRVGGHVNDVLARTSTPNCQQK